MCRQFLIASVLVLALTASARFARAGTPIVYCANDVPGVQFSLAVAEDNGLDDDIRLVAGTYQPAALLSATMQDTGSLEISGGWNADCSARNGGQTILDGQSQTRLLELFSQQANDVVVSDITFVNGASSDNHSSALRVVTEGLALVQRNIFLANHAVSDVAALSMVGGEIGTIALNNLVFGNENSGVSVYLTCGAAANSYVLAAGNTIVDNTATTLGAIGGMTVYCPGAMAYVVNNLLWANGGDLNLYVPAGIATLYDNDIGLQIGSMPGPDSSGNFSAAPIFAPGLLNFHLASNSPTINRGRNCIIGGIGCESALGDTDLAGVTRIQGQRVDIGAYESDVLLYSGFESTP